MILCFEYNPLIAGPYIQALRNTLMKGEGWRFRLIILVFSNFFGVGLILSRVDLSMEIIIVMLGFNVNKSHIQQLAKSFNIDTRDVETSC